MTPTPAQALECAAEQIASAARWLDLACASSPAVADRVNAVPGQALLETIATQIRNLADGAGAAPLAAAAE